MTVLSWALGRALKLPPRTHRRLSRLADLPVTMSDGTVLLTDRLGPAGHERGLPTLLMRTPYGRRGALTLEAHILAERGYHVVLQSVRGTHGSGGDYDPFRHDRTDGAETLVWLRQQPWCDGRVGVFGGSYCGYTMHAAAAGAEPGDVQSLAGSFTAADLRLLFRPYESLTFKSAASWIYGLDRQGDRGPWAGIRHALRSRRMMPRSYSHLPLREADQILAGEELPFFREWVDADRDDAYWDQRDVSDAHATAGAPVLLHAGWFDIFGPAQLADAAALFAAGRDTRLVVGPWNHSGGLRTRMVDLLSHFSQTLAEDPCLEDVPHVRLKLYGDERWFVASSWPIVTGSLRLHLGHSGRLDLAVPTSDARITWVDDPAEPPPAPGGAVLLLGGPKDNKEREHRDDVLTFTSSPLEEDLFVIGSPRVVVQAEGGCPSYDVAVRLCVVDEKGVSRNISDGLQRVDAPAATIDVRTWPTGVRIRRGHCIRLQIAGSLHPIFARNPHTGEREGDARSTVPAVQTVVIGPGHEGYVELPVVEAGPEGLQEVRCA